MKLANLVNMEKTLIVDLDMMEGFAALKNLILDGSVEVHLGGNIGLPGFHMCEAVQNKTPQLERLLQRIALHDTIRCNAYRRKDGATAIMQEITSAVLNDFYNSDCTGIVLCAKAIDPTDVENVVLTSYAVQRLQYSMKHFIPVHLSVSLNMPLYGQCLDGIMSIYNFMFTSMDAARMFVEQIPMLVVGMESELEQHWFLCDNTMLLIPHETGPLPAGSEYLKNRDVNSLSDYADCTKMCKLKKFVTKVHECTMINIDTTPDLVAPDARNPIKFPRIDKLDQFWYELNIATRQYNWTGREIFELHMGTIRACIERATETRQAVTLSLQGTDSTDVTIVRGSAQTLTEPLVEKVTDSE